MAKTTRKTATTKTLAAAHDAEPGYTTPTAAAPIASANPENEPGTVPDVSPANTPGGSVAHPPATGIDDPKDRDKNVRTGTTVLYRVSPLDPPEIKNAWTVEDADLLPATVKGGTTQGDTEDVEVADLVISLPDGREVVKTNVTRGADSGQWRVGPDGFAVTGDSRPDAADYFDPAVLDEVDDPKDEPGVVGLAVKAQERREKASA